MNIIIGFFIFAWKETMGNMSPVDYLRGSLFMSKKPVTQDVIPIEGASFLSPREQTHLSQRVEPYRELYGAFQSLLDRSTPEGAPDLSPFPPSRCKTYEEVVREASPFVEKGEEFCARGQVGIIFLAGGDGSRLGSPIPKALFPFSPIREKSLLQYTLEKVQGMCCRKGFPLPCIGLLVSPKSYGPIKEALQAHNFFGLPSTCITLVIQEDVPTFSREGKVLLKQRGELLLSPGGNGGLWSAFARMGVWKEWKARGVETVHILPIDNPLQDPLDPQLLGLLERTERDVVLGCVDKEPGEALGGVYWSAEGLSLREYGDPLPVQSPYGYSGACALFLDWILERESLFSKEHKRGVSGYPLPWHLAKKRGKVWVGEEGIKEIELYKMEQFIFDLFQGVKESALLLYPKSAFFSPLKSLEGKWGIAALQHALMERDKKRIESLIKWGKREKKENFPLLRQALADKAWGQVELHPALHTPYGEGHLALLTSLERSLRERGERYIEGYFDGVEISTYRS